MIKKKKCATKRGKWSQEYNVKVSVNPVKRKKKGAWTGKDRSSSKYFIVPIKDERVGEVNVFDGNKTKALKAAKVRYPHYTVVDVVPYMGSTSRYTVIGHPRRK